MPAYAYPVPGILYGEKDYLRTHLVKLADVPTAVNHMNLHPQNYVLLSTEKTLQLEIPLANKIVFFNHEEYRTLFFYYILVGILVICSKISLALTTTLVPVSHGYQYLILMVELCLFIIYKDYIHNWLKPDPVISPLMVINGTVKIACICLCIVYGIILSAYPIFYEYSHRDSNVLYLTEPVIIVFSYLLYPVLLKIFTSSIQPIGVLYLTREKRFGALAKATEDYIEGIVSEVKYQELEYPNYTIVKPVFYDLYGRICRFMTVKSKIWSDRFRKITRWYMTGFSLTSIYGDYRSKVMENNDINKFHGLYGRACAARIYPNPRIMKQFSEYVKRDWLSRWNKRLPNTETLTFNEYLKSRTPDKAKLYLAAVTTFREDLYQGKVHLDVNMKSHETGALVDGARPRNLYSPPAQARALGGYIAWIILKKLKELYPEIVHGLSCEDLSRRMEDQLKLSPIKGSPIYGSFDGSSHDAHQHFELIASVDNVILPQIFEEAFLCSDLEPILYNYVKNICFAMNWNFVQHYSQKLMPKKRELMTSGYIASGTWSGHFLRTTIGNSIRVVYYLKFICYRAQIPHVDIWVSGDDVLFRIPKESQDRFTLYMRTIYHFGDPVVYQHGLGQLCKALYFDSSASVFLSKDIIDCCGTVYVNRLPERVVAGSQSSYKIRFTSKKNTTFTRKDHATAVTLSIKSYASKNRFYGWYSKLRNLIWNRPLSVRAMKYFEENAEILLHENHRTYRKVKLLLEAAKGTYIFLADLWKDNIACFAQLHATKGEKFTRFPETPVDNN